MILLGFISMFIAGLCLGHTIGYTTAVTKKIKQPTTHIPHKQLSYDDCRCENMQDQSMCDFHICGRCDGKYID